MILKESSSDQSTGRPNDQPDLVGKVQLTDPTDLPIELESISMEEAVELGFVAGWA